MKARKPVSWCSWAKFRKGTRVCRGVIGVCSPSFIQLSEDVRSGDQFQHCTFGGPDFTFMIWLTHSPLQNDRPVLKKMQPLFLFMRDIETKVLNRGTEQTGSKRRLHRPVIGHCGHRLTTPVSREDPVSVCTEALRNSVVVGSGAGSDEVHNC